MTQHQYNSLCYCAWKEKKQTKWGSETTQQAQRKRGGDWLVGCIHELNLLKKKTSIISFVWPLLSIVSTRLCKTAKHCAQLSVTPAAAEESDGSPACSCSMGRSLPHPLQTLICQCFFFSSIFFLRKKCFVSWCMAGSTMQQRPFLAVACRGPGVSWVAMDVSTVSWLWPRSRLEHGSIMVQGLR